MRDIVPIGIVLILIGFAIVIIGSLAGQGGKSDAKVAVGGFIGPIPFGFAKDRPMLYAVIGLLAFLIVAWIVLRAMR